MKTNSANRNLSSLFLHKKVEVKLTYETLIVNGSLTYFSNFTCVVFTEVR